MHSPTASDASGGEEEAVASSALRRKSRWGGWRTLAWLCTLLGWKLAHAGDLIVAIADRAGKAVPEVAVTAAALMPRPAVRATTPEPAIMDQRNLAFVPQLLVVGVGAEVQFPNNDTVSHQVYSFSPAKRFQLPLYKGAQHRPVTFDKPGLVVLGCNIHDQMVGYIYVTDAGYYGKSDAQGTLHLNNLPAGDYTLTWWSPYIADPPEKMMSTVHVAERDPVTVRVQLSRDLRARPEPGARQTDWSY
ncbi:MAG: methylamine utilization protein [Steroidobacteraceae bacterium]